MIKANELRIGNIIRFHNRIEPERFIKINARFFSSLAGGRPLSELKDDEEINWYHQPIELTPDILEAAGCKKDVIDGWNLWVNGNLFVIRKLVSSNGYTLSVGDYCLCDMEYLHTFQNAYYCLTGEELQIDVTKLEKL